jgi:hypothetical protein
MLLDAHDEPQVESDWLTIGRLYHVLSVISDSHGRWLVRIMGDSEPGLGLFSLRQFEIVSDTIPSSWIVTWNNEGVFELTTKAWSEQGFWDRYFDNDPIARKIFERERQKIIEAEL